MNNESRDSQSMHNIHIIEKTADFFMFLKEAKVCIYMCVCVCVCGSKKCKVVRRQDL